MSSSDSEVAVANVRAQVMTYDESNRKWVPSGNGESSMSKVQIYQHKQNNTYRVVARKLNDHEVVINSALMKGMRYNKATPTFHQWRDARQVYGLNFATDSDAETFGTSILNALESVTDSSDGPLPSPTKGRFAPSESDIKLMAERQQQLNLERQKEREQELNKAEEEADQRRIRLEEDARKKELVKQEEEKRNREANELASKLSQQRDREEAEAKRIEEMENDKKHRAMEDFDRRQQELDEQREKDLAMEKELESRNKSSPRLSPAKSQPEIAPINNLATFGHLRKASGNIVVSGLAASKHSDSINQDNIDTPANPDTPTLSINDTAVNLNIPSPPPDMPDKVNFPGQSKATSQQSSGAALNRRNTPQALRTSAQSNMMSDLSAALNRRRNNGDETASSTTTTTTNTSNAAPSSFASAQPTGFKFDKQKSSTLDRNPKSNSLTPSPNKQLSKTDSSNITSKELQTLKQEILSEVKVELERTKQEILTAIRLELSKKP